MYAAVYIGIDVEILVSHRVENAKRLLRSGSIVEIDQGSAVHLARENGEIGPYGREIIHRMDVG